MDGGGWTKKWAKENERFFMNLSAAGKASCTHTLMDMGILTLQSKDDFRGLHEQVAFDAVACEGKIAICEAFPKIDGLWPKRPDQQTNENSTSSLFSSPSSSFYIFPPRHLIVQAAAYLQRDYKLEIPSVFWNEAAKEQDKEKRMPGDDDDDDEAPGELPSNAFNAAGKEGGDVELNRPWRTCMFAMDLDYGDFSPPQKPYDAELLRKEIITIQNAMRETGARKNQLDVLVCVADDKQHLGVHLYFTDTCYFPEECLLLAEHITARLKEVHEQPHCGNKPWKLVVDTGIYNGTLRMPMIQKAKTCASCKSTKKRRRDDNDGVLNTKPRLSQKTKKCAECKGAGFVYAGRRYWPIGFVKEANPGSYDEEIWKAFAKYLANKQPLDPKHVFAPKRSFAPTVDTTTNKVKSETKALGVGKTIKTKGRVADAEDEEDEDEDEDDGLMEQFATKLASHHHLVPKLSPPSFSDETAPIYGLVILELCSLRLIKPKFPFKTPFQWRPGMARPANGGPRSWRAFYQSVYDAVRFDSHPTQTQYVPKRLLYLDARALTERAERLQRTSISWGASTTSTQSSSVVKSTAQKKEKEMEERGVGYCLVVTPSPLDGPMGRLPKDGPVYDLFRNASKKSGASGVDGPSSGQIGKRMTALPNEKKLQAVRHLLVPGDEETPDDVVDLMQKPFSDWKTSQLWHVPGVQEDAKAFGNDRRRAIQKYIRESTRPEYSHLNIENMTHSEQHGNWMIRVSGEGQNFCQVAKRHHRKAMIFFLVLRRGGGELRQYCRHSDCRGRYKEYGLISDRATALLFAPSEIKEREKQALSESERLRIEDVLQHDPCLRIQGTKPGEPKKRQPKDPIKTKTQSVDHVSSETMSGCLSRASTLEMENSRDSLPQSMKANTLDEKEKGDKAQTWNAAAFLAGLREPNEIEEKEVLRGNCTSRNAGESKRRSDANPVSMDKSQNREITRDENNESNKKRQKR